MPKLNIKLILKTKPLYFLLLLVPCILYYWNITTYYSYKIDEYNVVYESLKFGSGDLNPHNFWYGTFFKYLVFLLYGLFYTYCKVFNVISSQNDFVKIWIDNPDIFFILARIATATFGILTCLVTALIAKTIYGNRTAIASFAIASLTPILLFQSHYAMVDIPMLFFIVLSIYLCVLSVHSIEKKNLYFYLACASAGFAMGNKLTGTLLAVPIFMTSLNLSKIYKENFLIQKRLCYGVVITILFFIISTPYALLDYSTFLKYLSWLKVSGVSGWLGTENQKGILLKLYLTKTILPGLGYTTAALAILSLIYQSFMQLKKPEISKIILISFIIAYTIFMSYFQIHLHHYILPIVPLLVILAASLIDSFSRYINRSQSLVMVICLLLSLVPNVLMLPTLLRSFSIPSNVNNDNLGKWIEQFIPHNSKVLNFSNGLPIKSSPEVIQYILKVKESSEQNFDYLKKRNWFYALQIEKAKKEHPTYFIKNVNVPILAREEDSAYKKLLEDSINDVNNFTNFDYLVILEFYQQMYSGNPQREQGTSQTTDYMNDPRYQYLVNFFKNFKKQSTLVKSFTYGDKKNGYQTYDFWLDLKDNQNYAAYHIYKVDRK